MGRERRAASAPSHAGARARRLPPRSPAACSTGPRPGDRERRGGSRTAPRPRHRARTSVAPAQARREARAPACRESAQVASRAAARRPFAQRAAPASRESRRRRRSAHRFLLAATGRPRPGATTRAKAPRAPSPTRPRRPPSSMQRSRVCRPDAFHRSRGACDERTAGAHPRRLTGCRPRRSGCRRESGRH